MAHSLFCKSSVLSTSLLLSFLFFFNTIFNSCLKNGLYPDKLKIARVIPFHKGGSNSELQNYRPISILSTFNKILETIIKQRLITFFGLSIMFLSRPSLALKETIRQPLPLRICMN